MAEKFTKWMWGNEVRGRGDESIAQLDDSRVAVVGTRRATPYGIALACMAGRAVAELGLTLLTGAELGCGSAAARAAKNAGGEVVVMSAVGLDANPWPASSKDVYGSADLVLSVAADNEGPQRFKFPLKNRLMGLTCGAVIVCETGLRSGVTTVAEAAMEIGHPVLTFPGSIFSPTSEGCHDLIENGALMATSEYDLTEKLADLFALPRYRHKKDVPVTSSDVMWALTASPMRPDDLAKALGEQPLDVLRQLAQLEMDGRVERMPDGRYSPSMHELARF